MASRFTPFDRRQRGGRGGRASFTRTTACALVVTLLSACMTWQPIELADSPPPPDALSERIRVTRVDSSRVVLEYVAVRGDSIAGVVEGGGSERVAFEDIRMLEAYRFEPGFLVIPAVVAVVVFFAHFPLEDDMPSTVTSDSPGP